MSNEAELNPLPKITFVASCRLNGTTLFFLERMATNFDDAEVVVEEDRRIPVFTSDELARAEIARRFPLPRGTPVTERSSMAELAAAMEDQYAPMMKLSYDLDVALAWCRAPSRSEQFTPGQALAIW